MKTASLVSKVIFPSIDRLVTHPAPLSCVRYFSVFSRDDPQSTCASGAFLPTPSESSPVCSSGPHLPSHFHTPPSGHEAAQQPSCSFDAAAAAEAQGHIMHAIQSCANGLEWVHTASGLPWWASIPACTLAMRLLLLPISLRQAKIIRTNYIIYKEAMHLTDRQMGLTAAAVPGEQQAVDSRASLQHSPAPTASSPGPGPGSESGGQTLPGTQDPASPGSQVTVAQLTVAQRLQRSQHIVMNFDMLRQKCDTPHPVWILINPLLQLPCFILMGVTLRMMAFAHWPHFQTEGALWFTDLTQVALVIQTMEAPLGPAGLILPGSILALTLTSLKLGFGASGAKMQQQHAGDNLGRLLRVLPPLLYGLTVLNLYVKVQLPHAALLHWLTSSGFTLGLQLGLKSPALRRAMKLASPEQIMQRIQDILPALAEQQGAAMGGAAPAAAPMYSAAALPMDLVARVQSSDSPDVLVIMGSQLSARHRYGEAMYCFDHALLLNAGHTRAHYSRGQVFSLVGRWAEAEDCFRRAAQGSEPGTDNGQALYCVGTALHTQGKLSEAVEVYRDAARLWQGQTVVLFSLANALDALGRVGEARGVVEEALLLDSRTPRSPFKAVLQQLALKLQAADKNE